ncbi:putative LRR receptor-like serine/threonine-protein kinase IRK [Apium graveolens]|uniref:putative LRR receptor-like serine/threonine-protein kinase IRK n=1 Tax=Apium graveolens TaxID=4045 RepID=UPI003D799664
MLLSLLSSLVFFVFLTPLHVYSDSSPGAFSDDILGLIVFKADLNDPLSKLTSWNEDDSSPCNWFGIKCHTYTNRVTELHLDGLSLSGHIGRGLLRLEFLHKLSLSNNNFTGPITAILSQFDNLQVIDLSHNSFSGFIPDQLFLQCRSLRVISLAKNNLTGPIPNTFSSCSTLKGVNFSSNSLSGQLPSGIWSLTALRSLDLSDNLLEGVIPRGIQSLYDLRAVSLRKNRFYGQLPDDIGGCLLLKSLDFSDNLLSGELPWSMQKLSLCNSLDLGGNLLSGEFPDWISNMRSLETLDLSANNFSGEVAYSIGELQFLKQLNLSTNQFTGSLPESLKNCISLKTLDVSWNLLAGNLPAWIFELGLETVSLSGNRLNGSVEYPFSMLISASYQSIQVLDLSSNALFGEIPSGVRNLSRLQFLNMSRNFLVGSIPATFGELKAARVLDLSHNWLNGSIPSGIGGAAALLELWLENNFLIGEIPLEIGNCSSLTTLILSQNNLTGSVPMVIANLTELQTVDFSFNQLSGSLPKELTNLSYLHNFNISHNNLQGELPVGGFFDSIPLSSLVGNPSLCGSIMNNSCNATHPKPIVLNPDSSSGSSNHGSLSPNLHHKKIILSISALIAIGAAVLIALGVLTVAILNLHARSSMSGAATSLNIYGGDEFSPSHTSESNYGKLVMFSGDSEFVDGAHGLLNKDCEIGHGGFGIVYETALRDGRSVAIKKLNASGLMKSQEDFEREVKKLGKIRHQNLVALEGYYWTQSLQLLINEYVCNGSLYMHLHGEQFENCLSWKQRFNIILGTAKGLEHLHRLNVIHYNLKPSNILIGSCFEAKVGDFGLASLLPLLDRYNLSSKIQSALGYMAPEFACQTVKITEKCDIYGFGILILEIVTGNRPVEYMEDDVVVLCDMVREALDEGKSEDCVDRKLQGNFPVEEAIPVIKLGLICASQVPSNRPDMEEVIKILELIRCPSESQGETE